MRDEGDGEMLGDDCERRRVDKREEGLKEEDDNEEEFFSCNER